MFNPQTSPDTGNATSSPASPGGPLQLDLLGGPTTGNCGPAAPRASRSPSRVKAKPRMTIGTCGPTSFASSVPDGPLSSWENRLRRRLARTGSTECLLTWKHRTTPAGRSLSQLVPSTRPTEGIGSGLWPTPTTRDWKDSPGMSFAPRKDGASRLDLVPRQVYWIAQNTPHALWRTPNAHVVDAKSNVVKLEGRKPSDPQVGLADQVAALWPTPCARDHMPAHSPEYVAEKKAQGHGMAVLPDYVQHAPIGTGPDGSSDTTEKPGALNPAFVFWLMGFPPEWVSCAPAEMPSSRKSRRK